MTATVTLDGTGPARLRRPSHHRLTWLLAACGGLVVLVVLSVAVGSRDITLSELLGGLGGGTDTLGQAAVVKRVPRTVLAVLIGASLAMAGTVMQGVTRNPLADPGILGVNMGASLAVVIGIAWFGLTSVTGTIWTAIAGAALAVTFVYAVGSLGHGGPTPLKLTLAGAATTAALVSFITAIALPRNDIAGNIRSWQIGGVGGASFDAIGQVLPFLVAGFVVCVLCARALNSLALGDELAAGLGERVALARATATLGAVLLCGAATAVAGPIAFVGLIVPHACRLVFGVDHRWLLVSAAVIGACLVTGADILGRVVARPSEIDVGIITAFVGAPVLIHIVRRQKLRML